MASCAASPVRYTGSDVSATRKNNSKLARIRWSLRRMNASSNRPRPITVPTVGTWFIRRCRCGVFRTNMNASSRYVGQ